MTRRQVQLSPCRFDFELGRFRFPPRRLALRYPDYEDEYDFSTIFYDCFWNSTGDAVILIGPPALGAYELDELKFLAQPSNNLCHVRSIPSSWIERIVVPVPAGTTSLVLYLGDNEFHLAIQPGLGEIFRGRRVMFTMYRDNAPQWIIDWIHFHRVHHGCEAVLLYDNCSSPDNAREVRAALYGTAGEIPTVLLDWPFQYGVADYRCDLSLHAVDSVYCQWGMLEHARLRFLSAARSVLNLDVDELVVSDDSESVFRAAETSQTGYIAFDGRWIESRPVRPRASPDAVPRHRDFGYVERSQFVGCQGKWAGVPSKMPEEAQWSVHYVLGMLPSKPPSGFEFRHFKRINTNWNIDAVGSSRLRTADEVTSTQDLRLDRQLLLKLEEAFGRSAPSEPDPAPASPTELAYRRRVEAGRLAAEGDDAAAATSMRAALASMPDHPGFHLYLADIEERLGHSDEAGDLRERAENLRDRDPWYHFQIGRSLRQREELELVRKHHQRAVEVDPKFVFAYLELAALERYLGRSAEALSILLLCAERLPDDAVAQVAVAAELNRHGRITDAIRHARTATELDKIDPVNWHLLARLLRRAGRLSEAEDAIAQGLAVDALPERMKVIGGRLAAIRVGYDHFTPTLRCSQLHVVKTLLALDRGDFSSAETAANEVLKARWDDPDSYQLAARVLSARGDEAAARDMLDRGIDVAKRNVVRPIRRDLSTLEARDLLLPRKVLQLAAMLTAAGCDDKAIAELQDGLSRYPADFHLREKLAQVLSRSGQQTRAIEVLREGIRKTPDAALLHDALSTIALDPKEAVEAARTAADLDPLNPSLKMRLARQLLACGDEDEAERCLRAALELEPEGGDLLHQFSLVLERRGQLAEALDAAERAAYRLPHRSGLRARLSMMLLRAGRLDEAERVIRQAYAEGFAEPHLHLRLSFVLHRRGDLDGAIEAALAAIKGGLESAAVRRHLSTLRGEKKEKVARSRS